METPSLSSPSTTSPVPKTSLTLPDDLICIILSSLPVDEDASITALLAAQLVSHHFSALSKSNSVWRAHLEHRWRHQYPIAAVVSRGGACVEYQRRFRKDQNAEKIVKDLVLVTSGRAKLVDKLVCELGKDVMEYLEKRSKAVSKNSDPDDWISVRYWSRYCSKALGRCAALETWDVSTQLRSLRAMKEEDHYLHYARVCAGFTAFVDYEIPDPEDVVTLLHHLNPMEVSPTLTPDMSLSEIVLLLWQGMRDAGYLPQTWQIECNFIDKVLTWVPSQWEPLDTSRDRPPLPFIGWIILYYLLANLPGETFNIQVHITAFNFRTRPLLCLRREGSETVWLDLDEGRTHSLTSLIQKYPKELEKEEDQAALDNPLLSQLLGRWMQLRISYFREANMFVNDQIGVWRSFAAEETAASHFAALWFRQIPLDHFDNNPHYIRQHYSWDVDFSNRMLRRAIPAEWLEKFELDEDSEQDEEPVKWEQDDPALPEFMIGTPFESWHGQMAIIVGYLKAEEDRPFLYECLNQLNETNLETLETLENLVGVVEVDLEAIKEIVDIRFPQVPP